jgi:hypothetical protein
MAQDETMSSCPVCEVEGKMSKTQEVEQILYGVAGPDQVTIACTVPTYHCGACDFVLTDHEAEDVRMKAVETYLAGKACRSS